MRALTYVLKGCPIRPDNPDTWSRLTTAADHVMFCTTCDQGSGNIRALSHYRECHEMLDDGSFVDSEVCFLHLIMNIRSASKDLVKVIATLFGYCNLWKSGSYVVAAASRIEHFIRSRFHRHLSQPRDGSQLKSQTICDHIFNLKLPYHRRQAAGGKQKESRILADIQDE